MIRTHDAGTLTAADAGTTVTLAGWVARRRDHGGVAFIDLREGSGVAQVVIRDEELAHSLRSEYCIKVTGDVSRRPEGNANPNLPSGEIEVIASEVEVLNPSAVLPFPVELLRFLENNTSVAPTPTAVEAESEPEADTSGAASDVKDGLAGPPDVAALEGRNSEQTDRPGVRTPNRLSPVRRGRSSAS